MGVANPRSLAWSAAETLAEAGATVGITYLDDRAARRVQPLIDQLSCPIACACDVREDDQIEATLEEVKARWGEIDFLIHSLAFADINDLKRPLSDCSREGYHLAMEVSAYSLLRLIHFASPLMSSGASVTTLTYLGAEVAMPAYGVMGPAKAALEAQVRYLARELGPRGIRVNAVSAGPIKTLAAVGIPGFKQLLKASGESTPLGRGVTAQEVAYSLAFLTSPLSGGITGEVLHVDGGAHAVR